MSDLEITVESNFRGALAERLVSLAKFARQPPVEYLASIVETALQVGNPIPLNADLAKYKSENTELRKRVQRMSARMPNPGAFVIALAMGPTAELAREAARRKLKPDELAQKILTHVATDKLFAAVLDE